MRLGNAFLILSIFLVILEFEDEDNDAWAYDFLPLLFGFFLKNFKISITFFGDFARIGEEITETEASFSAFLLFFEVTSLFIWRLNCAFTFCLKEKLFLLTIR